MMVTCIDCGGTWAMADALLPAALADGSIVEKTTETASWSYTQYHGVCANCQQIYKAAARKPKQRNVDEELRQIRQLVAQVRSSHPDWSIERAVHEAIEYLSGPEFEDNPLFRAWLIANER